MTRAGPRLVVAYPGPLPVAADSSVLMDDKLRTGMNFYRQHWPGEVVLATAAAPQAAPALGARAHRRGDLGFEVVTAATWTDAVRAATPDLLLAPLVRGVEALADLAEQSVYAVEFAPEEALASGLHTGSLPQRARALGGLWRRRKHFTALVRRARGIQCNGYPAYERFGDLNTDSLLYFDTRLAASHVAAARTQRRDGPATPLRLCFSGRLIPGKGPDHAVAALARLNEWQVPAKLTVFGDGPLLSPLRATAPANVEFRGTIPFDPDWTDYVREHVDLMVLPHVQGDPSGTYLESIGCGAPVVGYANRAWDALVRHHGIGWSAPLRDVDALASTIRALAAPESGTGSPWHQVRTRGLDFMADHPWTQEFTRRVDHLLSLS